MAIEKKKPNEAEHTFSFINLLTNAGVVMLALKNIWSMQAAYAQNDSIRLHCFGVMAGLQVAYLIYRVKKNQY